MLSIFDRMKPESAKMTEEEMGKKALEFLQSSKVTPVTDDPHKPDLHSPAAPIVAPDETGRGFVFHPGISRLEFVALEYVKMGLTLAKAFETATEFLQYAEKVKATD